jgi:hypothetical protein
MCVFNKTSEEINTEEDKLTVKHVLTALSYNSFSVSEHRRQELARILKEKEPELY